MKQINMQRTVVMYRQLYPQSLPVSLCMVAGRAMIDCRQEVPVTLLHNRQIMGPITIIASLVSVTFKIILVIASDYFF
jgi:hypothetical protein